MIERQNSFFSVGLLLFGLTPACASGPPLRVSLPVTRLVADAAPSSSEAKVDFYAVPVEVDTVQGQGGDPSGHVPPVAVRVPRGVVLSTGIGGPASANVAAPTRVMTRGNFTWSYRATPAQLQFPAASVFVETSLGDETVPLLPYGAFWIEVTNRGEHVLVLDPKNLRLRSNEPTLGSVLDAGAIEGRYQLMLGALHEVDTELLLGRDDLPVLRRRVALAPGASWKGYVVFDTKSYTADEYDAFLAQSGGVTIELSDGRHPVGAAHFAAIAETVQMICPAGNGAPSWARCGLVTR